MAYVDGYTSSDTELSEAGGHLSSSKSNPVTSALQRGALKLGSVDSLRLGEMGTVIGIETENAMLRAKLLCMGIVEGTSVVVTNIAPLKDPITVAVKGFRLSLRRSEARSIVISQRASR